MVIRASAPAKIILFGEHAVVYGQPAIAVPVSSLRAEAILEAADSDLTIIARDHDNQVLPFNEDNPLAKAAQLTLKTLDCNPPRATISVQSKIPIASGLGSGAAITAVVVRAVSEGVGQSLSTEQVNKLVYEIEKVYHGTPSGIDNTVVVYERAIYFVRGKPVETIHNAQAFTLLIADTGIPAPTKVAVSDVRRLVERQPEQINPLIEAIGQLVTKARRALQSGAIAQIGNLMCENHRLLQQLTVSSRELDALVDAAMAAGALGAKLSGGGRGGNMIALVTDETREQVNQALLDSGAARVFETTVERSVS